MLTSWQEGEGLTASQNVGNSGHAGHHRANVNAANSLMELSGGSAPPTRTAVSVPVAPVNNAMAGNNTSFFQHPDFGATGTPGTSTDVVPLGFFNQDGFGLGPDLFLPPVQTSDPHPANAAQAKPEYNSEGEEEQYDEDTEDDDIYNVEDMNSDDDDYEDYEDGVDIAYSTNGTKTSKRRRTTNNKFVAIGGPRNPQYMADTNRGAPLRTFTAINRRQRPRKRSPQLRETRPVENSLLQMQAPQARMMRNAPARTRSYEGSSRMPLRTRNHEQRGTQR